MKKLTLLTVTALFLITLSACRASIPENWRDGESDTETAETPETTAETAPETVSETAVSPVPHVPDMYGGVDMTELLGLNSRDEIDGIMPLDDSHIAVCALIYGGNDDWEAYDCFVINAEDWSVVYRERLNGFPWGEQRLFTPFGEHEAYLDTNLQIGGENEYEYYRTFISPFEASVQKLDNKRYTIGGHVIVQKDGGIYEDFNGELKEITPPPTDAWLKDPLKGRYYVFKDIIDDTKFVYSMTGYEWTWGFGVYDFETGECRDIPDSLNYYPVGVKDNIIFSQYADMSDPFGVYATDINTLETRYFLDGEVFPQWDESAFSMNNFTLSPDKERFLVCTNEGNYQDMQYTVYVINANDASVEWTYHFSDVYVGDVKFFGNGILVLSGKYYGRDQYAYVIPIEYSD